MNKIQPLYSLHGIEDRYLSLIEGMVDQILPKDLEKDSSWPHQLMKRLPLFDFQFQGAPGSLFLTYLCPAEYTTGVRRYVADMLTRWLIPGEPVALIGSISLNFHFVEFPGWRFFVVQENIAVPKNEEWEIIRDFLPSLIEEMRLNIQAVYHARYIASLRNMTSIEKNKIIQENLSSLLKRPSGDGDRTLHDQMNHFLLKLSAEERIEQVKKNISQLKQSRPKAFDRDLFYEMTHFTIQFKDQFSSIRETRHISRMIAFHYLFKKALQESVQKEPNKCHISLKIFKATLLDGRIVLSVLIGINFPIEKEQLLNAIRKIVPKMTYVKDSFLEDRRDVNLFYLEIQKAEPFAKDEIRQVRRLLPEEIRKQIENHVLHPIFMPRNEEELLRNLIALSKQLKYVKDLPQVSIHYESQTSEHLTFTILVASLKKNIPFKSQFRGSSTIQFSIEEHRIMGNLKNKMIKEGAILRATLNKSQFFRQDRSVDLLRARQKVAQELMHTIGEFRDYNGGMILKQDESLDQLRKEIGSLSEAQEFLLENYFYSLRPGIMQTVHEPTVLKDHFNLLLEMSRNSLSKEEYIFKSARSGKFSLYFIGAIAPTFKEYTTNAIEKLKIPSYDLTMTHLQVHQLSTLGYILRAEQETTPFVETIHESLRSWKSHFSCSVNFY